MASTIPPELSALFRAATPDERGNAWSGFVEKYSAILLHASKNGTSSHDDAMDRYVFVLEALQEDGFRRLRAFSPDGRAKFSTWLHVVARRLCVDHHRHLFGRKKAEDPRESDAREVDRDVQEIRYRLAHLLSDELEVDGIPDFSTADAESHVADQERTAVLRAAIARLSSRDRLMITLRFEDGLSVREISRIMRFRSPFQVYRRLRKVLDGLRVELVKKGITQP